MLFANLISTAITLLEKNIKPAATAQDQKATDPSELEKNIKPAATAQDQKATDPSEFAAHLKTLLVADKKDDATLAQGILAYKKAIPKEEDVFFVILQKTAEAASDPNKKMSARGAILQLIFNDSSTKDLLGELRATAIDYIATLKKPTPTAEAKTAAAPKPAVSTAGDDKKKSAIANKFGSLMAKMNGQLGGGVPEPKQPVPPAATHSNKQPTKAATTSSDKKFTAHAAPNPLAAAAVNKTLKPSSRLPLPPTPKPSQQEDKEVEELKREVAQLKKQLADKELEAKEDYAHATEHYQYQWHRAETAEESLNQLQEHVAELSFELPAGGEFILPSDLVAPAPDDLEKLIDIITQDLILNYHYAFALIVLFPEQTLEEIERNIAQYSKQKANKINLTEEKNHKPHEMSIALKEGDFIMGIYHLTGWRLGSHLERGILPSYAMGAAEFRSFVAASNPYIAAKDSKTEVECSQPTLLELKAGEPEYLQKKVAAAFYLKVLHNMELCTANSPNARLITKYKNFLLRNFSKLRNLAMKKFEALPHTLNDMHAELQRLLNEKNYADKLKIEQIAAKKLHANLNDAKDTRAASTLLQPPPQSFAATIFSPVRNFITLFNVFSNSSPAATQTQKPPALTAAAQTAPPAPSQRPL